MNKFQHLSYSSISRFLACPAMFKAYMTGKKPLPTVEQIAGKNRHSEIEKHLLENSIDTAPLGKRLKNFCKRILGPITAAEASFNLDYLVCDIVGRIDAYSVRENQAVVVDFKSNCGNNVDELQVQIYALAVKAMHPEVNTIHAAFAYIIPDYYELKTYFEDDLVKFSETLSNTIDRISIESRFDPTPNPKCATCEFTSVCNAAKNFEIPEKLDSQNIVTMATNLFAVEALIDKGKTAIKEYLIEHGLDSLPVGDSRYYLSNSTPALRLGKIKVEKEKKALEKVCELEASLTNISEKTFIDDGSTHISIVVTPEASGNVVELHPGDKAERVRMSELVEILKRKGRLPQDATNAEGSRVIKELLGVPFISATEQEKRDLKMHLLA